MFYSEFHCYFNTANTHDTVTSCTEVQSLVQHLIGTIVTHDELSLTNIFFFRENKKTFDNTSKTDVNDDV